VFCVALISSRVDYCNSVLYTASVIEVHLCPLQSVLNAAARLITGKRKFDHITSTNTRQRIVSSSHCTVLSDGSVYSGISDDRSYTSMFVFTWRPDNTAFSTTDHAVSLSVVLQPGTLCQQPFEKLSSSTSSFCSHLKTQLFSRAYGVSPPFVIAFAVRMGEHKFSYLLTCTLMWWCNGRVSDLRLPWRQFHFDCCSHKKDLTLTSLPLSPNRCMFCFIRKA